MRTLTASDRNTLIKLASELPKGDETRKAILAGLQAVKTAADDPKKITSLFIKELTKDSEMTESDVPEKLRSNLEKAIQKSLEEGMALNKKTIYDIAFKENKPQFAKFKSFKSLDKAVEAVSKKLSGPIG